jgi:hypothetical protein
MGELPESWHLISDLAPWERNARAHTDESTRRLVAASGALGSWCPSRPGAQRSASLLGTVAGWPCCRF